MDRRERRGKSIKVEGPHCCRPVVLQTVSKGRNYIRHIIQWIQFHVTNTSGIDELRPQSFCGEDSYNAFDKITRKRVLEQNFLVIRGYLCKRKLFSLRQTKRKHMMVVMPKFGKVKDDSAPLAVARGRRS
jgi:hypothetical protein